MLTELPEVLCPRDIMYRLKYSDSYFGNVYNCNDCTIEAHLSTLKRLNYCLENILHRFSSQ